MEARTSEALKAVKQLHGGGMSRTELDKRWEKVQGAGVGLGASGGSIRKAGQQTDTRLREAGVKNEAEAEAGRRTTGRR